MTHAAVSSDLVDALAVDARVRSAAVHVLLTVVTYREKTAHNLLVSRKDSAYTSGTRHGLHVRNLSTTTTLHPFKGDMQ